MEYGEILISTGMQDELQLAYLFLPEGLRHFCVHKVRFRKVGPNSTFRSFLPFLATKLSCQCGYAAALASHPLYIPKENLASQDWVCIG